MKKLITVFLLLLGTLAKSQTITAKIIDSVSLRPLSYAIVIYHNNEKVIYSDISGHFTLALDSLTTNDNLEIQFLGFRKYHISKSSLYDGIVIKMSPEMQELNPVIVTNCRRFEEFTLNKKTVHIRNYIGPGPETRLVIISRYYNSTGRNSFVNKMSIYIDEKSPNLQIPIRLRWYEWDNEKRMPGKELTDTNIVVFPYKEGWNDFDIPANTINCPKSWVVFGIEFIYPSDYKLQYDTLKSGDDKIKWLSDMQNRWSLGLQYVTEEDEGGFYIVNNGSIQRYNKKYDRYFLRPAIKFTISFCKE